MNSKQFNTAEKRKNMLKEIDRDESHSHKEKIIFITPLMAYKITQQYNGTPLRTEVFPQCCTHAPPPPLFCYIPQSFLKERIKLFVFQESETVPLHGILRMPGASASCSAGYSNRY
jgi:hypothetical protein